MDWLHWDSIVYLFIDHVLTYGGIYTALASLTSPHVQSHWLSKLAGGSVDLAQGPGGAHVPPEPLVVLGPGPEPPSVSRRP